MDLHEISKKYADKKVEVRDTSKVYVDGERLDILEFEANPHYESWEHEDYTYNMAVHEDEYSRSCC